MKKKYIPSSPSSNSSAHTELPKTHIPVLLQEVMTVLSIAKDDIVVDATVGGMGHAREILSRLGKRGMFIGFDADASALERARNTLATPHHTVRLVNDNFRTLDTHLKELGVVEINKALFDLGWNSEQLFSGRGFSFRTDEPLVMTYASGATHDLMASTIVNEWSEESLADVFFGFGEERYARRIARMIVARREEKLFTTARELAEAILECVPPASRRGRIHPATRVFQALRIATNDELGALERGLTEAWKALSLYGRIAVISFHSVEDRLVKRLMKSFVEEGGRLLFKRPLTASDEEVRSNPRSRSAKLRAIEKVVSR
ncbi:MAG TPA: 16S rRNA (cytosine(1402)-N(4))-methyltransferase RsmH [Candidatus Paceibacterota bacterium]